MRRTTCVVLACIALVLLLGAAASARAATVGEWVAESFRLHEEIKAIQAEAYKNTRAERRRLEFLGNVIGALERPPRPEAAAEHKADLERAEADLARTMRWVEWESIADPKARADQVAHWRKRNEQALADREKITAPFTQRRSALRAKHRSDEHRLRRAMAPFFRAQLKEHPEIKAVDVSATFVTASVKCRWKDAAGRDVASVSVRFAKEHHLPKEAAPVKGKPWVYPGQWRGATGWAGPAALSFAPRKKEWLGPGVPARILKELVDLDGLAKVELAEPGVEGLGALIARSLEAGREHEDILRQSKEASREAEHQVSLSNAAIQFLKQPYSPDRLAGFQKRVPGAESRVKICKTLLELVDLKDPDERLARLRRHEAEQQKVLNRRDQIWKPFNDRVRALRRLGKERQAEFDRAVEELFRLPAGAYPVIAARRVEATFGSDRMRCTWTDDDGKPVSRAFVTLKRKHDVPSRAERVDGKYPVKDSMTGDSVEAWAGAFRVLFYPGKLELHKKGRRAKMIAHFVDLPAMAEIKLGPPNH